MAHKSWLRIIIFSAAIVLFVMFVRHDIAQRMAFARHGKQAAATVVAELDKVRRPGGNKHVARIEYDGRTAEIESDSRLPLGSKVAVEYVPRAKGDLIRVLPASWPWASIFCAGLAVALALAVVQELRGQSWWAPQLIIVWRNPRWSSGG